MRLSPLGKTWLLDLDGTLVAHNGDLYGAERLLPGVAEFVRRIGPEDTVVILTSRPEERVRPALTLLAGAGLRTDRVVYGLPFGERILVNDCKPSGLNTAYAVNLPRDGGPNFEFSIDPDL